MGIRSYNQGLHQYTIGSRRFIMNSMVHISKLAQKKEDSETAPEPDLDPETTHFQPFQIEFLKKKNAIYSLSGSAGGNYYIYLSNAVKKLIPAYMGWKTEDWTVSFWKSKGQAQGIVNGFVKIDATKSGELHLYIRRSGNPVVCFKADKPDDTDIVMDVLIATISLPPPGKTAFDWDFKQNVTQNFTGSFKVIFDRPTNAVGACEDMASPNEYDAGWLRISNPKVVHGSATVSVLIDEKTVNLFPGKITCYKLMRKKNGASSYVDRSCVGLTEEEMMIEQQFDDRCIIPLFKADADGSVTFDYRKIPTGLYLPS